MKLAKQKKLKFMTHNANVAIGFKTKGEKEIKKRKKRKNRQNTPTHKLFTLI